MKGAKMNFRRLIAAFTGCAAMCIALSSNAAAQSYPSQTIRWIVTSGAGGAFDALARGLAPSLGKNLGVNVVVETVPGPDGWNRVYRAKPDGYTIGIGDPVGEFGNAAVNPVPYKPEELTWLGRINSASNLVVASKKSNYSTLDQLKSSKESIRLATFGVTAPLIQMIVLGDALGIKLSPVNFRTPADVIFGTVRGDVDIGNLGFQLWRKHIEAGSVTPIVIWDEVRNPILKEVPALPDIGQPALTALMTQRSVIAPPKVPADIRDKLNAALNKTVSEGDGLAFLKRGNFELNSLWGDEYQKLVDRIYKAIQSNRDTLRQFATR